MNIADLLEAHVEPTLLALGFKRLSDPSANPFFSRYAGDYFQIDFSLDPRGEFDTNIASAESGSAIPLWLILDEDDPDRQWAGSIVLDGSARSTGALKRLAELFNRHAILLTSRNDLLLPTLLKRQKKLAEEGWREHRLRAAITAALEYWQAKLFDEFVSTLLPWEGDLSPAMTAKMRFARKKLGAA